MKRMFIAIAILLTILGLDIYSRNIIARDTKELAKSLDAIKMEIVNDDFEAVYKGAEDIIILFDEKRSYLTPFVRRDYLTNVDIALHGLLAYANKENAADLSSEVDKAAAQLQMIDNIY